MRRAIGSSCRLLLLLHILILLFMIPFLPLQQINHRYEPALSAAIQRVVDSGWYLLGKEVERFEHDFAAYVGTSHCVGVANGLDALTLALMAMKDYFGWETEAQVIVPNMTFVATAEAVVRAGLVPVFAEVDDSALLTVEAVDAVYTPRVRAVIPVHLYGKMAPMPALKDWADAHQVQLLEDAAQAHGAACEGIKAGAWGIMAAFSFYPGKNLGALGDGGAVTVSNEALARRVRMLANYGAERKYHHTALGMNSRLDEIQAAVLNVKLPHLDADNRRRREIAAIYASHISHPLVRLPYDGETETSVFHIYALRTAHREALQAHLAEAGIQTLIHYPFALTQQPALAPYASEAGTSESPSWALKWAAEELSLPISPVMTDAEALEVCEVVNSFRA